MLPAPARLGALLAIASLCGASDAAAQSASLASVEVAYNHDTGWVSTNGSTREVVASFTVRMPGSDWMRLHFASVDLAGDPKRPSGAIVRITSHKDGDVQELNAISIDQWQLSTAYMNGDALQVEIVATPGTGASRIAMHSIVASQPRIESQCGASDDRLPSNDPRAARLLPVGCSGWMIDDCGHCFLTAGHCSSSSNSVQVVQFNVPPSNSNGNLNQPPASDQYPADPSSRQSNGGQGVGNDWAYFGAFPNSNTGLTASQAQGSWYTLAAPGSGTPGNIRITGYGVDGGTRNQVQQTHAGPWVQNSGTTLGYQADTQGGNSGSPVINDTTGEAIGIHTHGGCNTNGTGANRGTSSTHPSLQSALNNPTGVCNASCVPDDMFEENDFCAQAALLTPGSYTGLVAVGADQDFFEVTVPAGQEIQVDCLFNHAAGDLDMILWEPSCTLALDSSTSTTSNETVSWVNVGSGATQVRIQVFYYQGSGANSYDLDVAVINPDPCVGADDPLEENDDCVDALTLSDGTYPGLFASKTDWDYYRVNVGAGSTLSVDLAFTHADGDIDMFLYGTGNCESFAAGNVGCAGSIVCGFSGNDNETLQYTNSTGATESLILKVNVFPPSTLSDCNDYTLTLSGTSGGPIGSPYCAPNSLNSTGQSARLEAVGSFVASDNDLTLVATQLPPNQFGYFLASMNQTFVANPGGSSGNLCIGSGSARFVNQIQNSGPGGEFAASLDLTSFPTNPSQPVLGGQTWYFQGWYRDFLLVPLSNFTEGTVVSFF